MWKEGRIKKKEKMFLRGRSLYIFLGKGKVLMRGRSKKQRRHGQRWHRFQEKQTGEK